MINNDKMIDNGYVKKIILMVFFCLFAFNYTFGQNNEQYIELIKEAINFYKNKEYLKSAQKYNEAFILLGNKATVNGRYNAACSWALANEIDSAFIQLFYIAENDKYTDIEYITKDSDFVSLYEDARWEKIIEIIKTNGAKLDKTLVAMLDTIYQDDQKYRLELDAIEKKYGRNSKEMSELWIIINQKDAINRIKVKQILDERGWLGADIVGQQGNTALFLVIQHADIETQRKYLPMMREAVKNGNARASSLALLEDRVALGKGEKQIYGSQIRSAGDGYYVRPLIDPDNVDKRRAEVGLRPIEEYVSQWGITWDVEEYKKKLPEYEAREGIKSKP
jgi:hypothetical protein